MVAVARMVWWTSTNAVFGSRLTASDLAVSGYPNLLPISAVASSRGPARPRYSQRLRGTLVGHRRRERTANRVLGTSRLCHGGEPVGCIESVHSVCPRSLAVGSA